MRRQNTSVSRNVQSGFTYAADLNEVFHLQSGKIRRRINESVLTVQTGITPILLQPAGDGFLHKPVPFYDEQNAPSILEVNNVLKRYITGKNSLGGTRCNIFLRLDQFGGRFLIAAILIKWVE